MIKLRRAKGWTPIFIPLPFHIPTQRLLSDFRKRASYADQPLYNSDNDWSRVPIVSEKLVFATLAMLEGRVLIAPKDPCVKLSAEVDSESTCLTCLSIFVLTFQILTDAKPSLYMNSNSCSEASVRGWACLHSNIWLYFGENSCVVPISPSSKSCKRCPMR